MTGAQTGQGWIQEFCKDGCKARERSHRAPASGASEGGGGRGVSPLPQYGDFFYIDVCHFAISCILLVDL